MFINLNNERVAIALIESYKKAKQFGNTKNYEIEIKLKGRQSQFIRGLSDEEADKILLSLDRLLGLKELKYVSTNTK